MGCGTSFAKILLIIFNIIFWLSGAALLGVGIWLLVDPMVVNYFDIFKALENSGALLQYASYVFIAVGGFVLIVGFFGCCGAIKESKCMLGVYIVLLVLIMGLEIAAGVLAIIYKDKVLANLKDGLTGAFEKYYGADNDTGKAFTSGIRFAQTRLKCCGIKGPDDYPGMNYDPTCCVLKAGSRDKSVDTLSANDTVNFDTCKKTLTNGSGADGYPTGCYEGLQEWIVTKSIMLIGIGIGIACLELFGFIFAVCLCRNIGEED